MAGLKLEKRFFPLKNINAIIELFSEHCFKREEPDLAFISLLMGYYEYLLCSQKSTEFSPGVSFSEESLPVVKFGDVNALYQKFLDFVKGSIDMSKYNLPEQSLEFVKKVSDLIWSGLSKNYHDKAHLHTLFPYVTDHKLDSLGVSYAVVAACQLLGVRNVHLSLSEDHSWVHFGNETLEVTWHGRGVEDRRGQTVELGVAENSWLYLSGQAVKCDRLAEVACLIQGLNPMISSNSQSLPLLELKWRLLSLLYQHKALSRYPLALCALAELKQTKDESSLPSAEVLLKESVNIDQEAYHDKHIYPYTCLGKYYYTDGRYKKALKHWSKAAQSISSYNYNREDEEIYKEFLDITQEKIPNILKLAQEGYLIGSNHRRLMHGRDGNHNLDTGEADKEDVPFLQDAENYALLLALYDGLCEWEEGSTTPVLHITWAKHFVACISRFAISARRAWAEEEEDSSDEEDDVDKHENDDENKKKVEEETTPNIEPTKVNGTPVQRQLSFNSGDEETIKSAIAKLGSEVGEGVEEVQKSDVVLADLAKACGDSILNPDFLLGKGEPFTSPLASPAKSETSKLCTKQNGDSHRVEATTAQVPSPQLEFKSAKMKALKALLTCDKVNASALTLQLTAQSQVSLKHSLLTSDHVPRKRTRRT